MSRGLKVSLVVVLVVALCGFGVYLQLTAKDRALVSKVREAASRKLPPEEVEEFLGHRARMSTLRGGERKLLWDRDVQITDDPLAPALPPGFRSGKAVLFWVRPTYPERLIGITWNEENEPSVWYGRRSEGR